MPETEVKLSGLVTGTPGGVQTNRPVAGASVELYRVSSPTPASASATPSIRSQTGADGRWGPAQVDPAWYLEIVLTSPGSADHAFLPLAVSALVRHRASARGAPAWTGRCRRGRVVLMSRPRGYFGLPRDIVLLDGKEPADVKPGVPTDSLTTLRLPAAEIGRPVAALFNEERIVARGWPASENRIAVAELTY